MDLSGSYGEPFVFSRRRTPREIETNARRQFSASPESLRKTLRTSGAYFLFGNAVFYERIHMKRSQAKTFFFFLLNKNTQNERKKSFVGKCLRFCFPIQIHMNSNILERVVSNTTSITDSRLLGTRPES